MPRRSPAGSADAGSPPLLLVAAGAAIAFLLTLLFRFNSAEFANDHFMHLAEGRQVLSGEWPVRDFFDFGLPLQVLTSAVTLVWSGPNLYGEALVTSAFIAGGAAFTFAAAAAYARSVTIATAVTLIAVATLPRLYNYPKVFFYAWALWAAWRYAQRPEPRRAVMLGAAVGSAFLFRHDHGLYIGLASIPLFVITHWGQVRTGVGLFARYAGTVVLLALPFLLFVQFTVGLPWYLSDLVPGVETSTAPRFNLLPIAVDARAPLVRLDDPPVRRISVRWRDTLDAATREGLETKYHLGAPVADGPATWSYVALDESHATIRALVDDPAVVDTNGIDRGAGVLAVRELWYEWLNRRVPLFRLHLLPGLFAPANALALWYYLTWLIALAALLLLVTAWWRGQLPRQEGAAASMAVLLSLIVIETLVRGSPDSRLPDVSATVAITMAWAAGRWVRGAASRGRTALRVAAVTILGCLLLWSTGTYARAGETLDATRLLVGPSAVLDRFQGMRARLRRAPIEEWDETAGGYRGLTRYASACTLPEDRLLVTWFEPIVYVYADRDFAGGRVFFDGGWHDSTRDQQFTVDRLRRQRVPVVFIRDEFDLMFRKYFPLVAAYVDANYVRTAPTDHPEQVTGYQVWLQKGRTPVRTYTRLGLPCFR